MFIWENNLALDLQEKEKFEDLLCNQILVIFQTGVLFCDTQ